MLAQELHVGGHHHRLQPVQRQTVRLTPVGKAITGGEVRQAGVGVTDRGDEEFPEAPLRHGIGQQINPQPIIQTQPLAQNTEPRQGVTQGKSALGV